MFLKSVRSINALKLNHSDISDRNGIHMKSSEPYFYETSYTYDKHMLAIPVDTNGWCVVAKEGKSKGESSDLPKNDSVRSV